ncbi:MAG: hypothetical protein HQK50_11530 [Oligoflexia bacterium]|nr:hypothetical protein [Oligoflexia bacterium]
MFDRYLKKQNRKILGFSLIEVTIAVALLAGLTLAAVRLSQNQSGGAQRAYAHNDILHFLETYSLHFANQGNCFETLKTLQFNSSTLSNNIANVKKADGTTILTPNTNLALAPSFGKVKVTQMAVKVTDATLINVEQRADISVNFSYQQNGRTFDYAKTFTLYVVLETNLFFPAWKQVKRCYGMKERYDSGVCRSVGGTDHIDTGNCTGVAIPSKTVAAFYNTCPLGVSFCCPLGWSFADATPGRPDLRGRFMRARNAGAVASTTRDPLNRLSGDLKGYQTGMHTHSSSPFNFYRNRGGAGGDGDDDGGHYCRHDDSDPIPRAPITTTLGGGAETEMRPENVALTICIKD